MSELNPLISFIVPVYNVELYVERCIKSILKQSYSKFEIVAVNDGSPDNSLSILEKLANMDARIKIVSQENQGLSAARNTGIKNASGDYLIFVDSDDTIESDMAEKMVNELQEKKYDLVCCGMNHINSRGRLLGKFKVKKTGDFKGGLKATKQFLSGELFRPAAVNKLIRRHLITDNDCFFEPGIYFEDNLFIARLLYYSKEIVTINDCLYNYIRHESSITRTLKLKHISDMRLMLNKIESFLTEQNAFDSVKTAFNSFKAEKWGYLLKMVIKNGPNRKNFLAFRNEIPDADWNNISRKYRFFGKLGTLFPTLPGLFVKRP